MSNRPTAAQINAALKRAADAVRAQTGHAHLLRHPLPKHASERLDERWWPIGHIQVLGGSERWDVLYAPETGEGRLRTKR